MVSQRVIYENNPLIEVIIQYRFPKILALNSKDPIEFQDRIKDEYPIYQLALENQQEISFAINQNNVAAPIPSIIQKQPVRNHTFISSDGTYRINLTNEFISISTLSYRRWEEMIAHLKTPLAAFEEIYKPPPINEFPPLLMVIISIGEWLLDHKAKVSARSAPRPFCFAKLSGLWRNLQVSEELIWNSDIPSEKKCSQGNTC